MEVVIEDLVLWFNNRDLSIHVEPDDEVSFYYHGTSSCSETEATPRIKVEDLFEIINTGEHDIIDVKKDLLEHLNNANETIKKQDTKLLQLTKENQKLKDAIKIVRDL